MRKRICACCLALAFCVGLAASASAAESVTATLDRQLRVTCDGAELAFTDAQGNAVYPIVYRGTTYLPDYAMAGLFGLNITYDAAANTVELTDGGEVRRKTGPVYGNCEEVLIQIDSTLKTTYNYPRFLRNAIGGSVYPITCDGTLYLPVRAVANMLGLAVSYRDKTILLTDDPKQAVLNLVDNSFSGGSLSLMCFIFPGTGPWVLDFNNAEYGERVKALFASYDWKHGEGAEGQTDQNGYMIHMGNQNGGNVLQLESGSNTVTHLGLGASFHAEGAEKLCDELTSLWPGPEIRYSRVAPVKAENSDHQTCAKAYMSAFEKSYLESGAVKDFDLRSVSLLNQEGASDTNVVFRTSYAVKPADTHNSYWQDKPADKDGWVMFQIDIGLSQDEAGNWCFNYMGGWD